MVVHLRSLSFAAALIAAPLIAAGNASANTCGKHDDIIKALSVKYQEARRIMGVIDQRAVMEIYMSPKGTWTVLVTDTSGNSCITAAGEDYQEVKPAVVGIAS